MKLENKHDFQHKVEVMNEVLIDFYEIIAQANVVMTYEADGEWS